MTTARLVAEIVLGVLYLVGAVFNVVYTLGHARELYGAFLEGAWHEGARWLLRKIVLPNATAVTVAVILFELAVAIMLFTRGDLARVALIAGAVFCLIASAVSSPGGTAGNLALAAIQIALAVAR